MKTSFVAICTVCTASVAFGQESVYKVIDLGPPPAGQSAIARGLNNHGDVTGFFHGNDDSYNAFVCESEGIFDISPAGDNQTFGRAINDAGMAVGWTTHFGPVQRAFLFDGTNFLNLGTFGGTASDAHDIDDFGRIVGAASPPAPNDYMRAALWEDGDIHDLGTLGGVFSEAWAISETGMIVGWSWNADWDARAVYWTPNLEGPIELPTFNEPWQSSYARDVNNHHTIVGQVQVDSPDGLTRYRAALWEDGEVHDLGLLPEAGEGVSLYGGPALVSSSAASINDAGIIIGNSFPPAAEPEVRHGPFIYQDGVMTNLNDLLHPDDASGWMITDVVEINEQGVIAANARFNDSSYRAVLLEPVEPGPLGDLDGDSDVDFDDLTTLLANWGTCADPPAPCAGDLDDDGDVDFDDLTTLLANWT